jgi:hypothetical protein
VRNNQLLAGNGNTSNANKSKYARRRLVGAQIELTSDVAIACPLWQLRRLSTSPIFCRSTHYIGLKKEKCIKWRRLAQVKKVTIDLQISKKSLIILNQIPKVETRDLIRKRSEMQNK